MSGTTTTSTRPGVEIHEAWFDSPLVKRAFAQAGDEATAADVLEALSSLLNELEERTGGIPFTDMLAGVAVDASWKELRCSERAMRNAGLSDEAIAEVTGLVPTTPPPSRVGGYKGSNGIQPWERQRVIDMAIAGFPVAKIANKLNLGGRTVYRVLNKAGIKAASMHRLEAIA